QALLVEALGNAPIKALPGVPIIMERQPQKCQHGFIDLVFVDIHEMTLSRVIRKISRSCPYRYLRGSVRTATKGDCCGKQAGGVHFITPSLLYLRTQFHTRLALTPWSRDIWATEAPGARQAATKRLFDRGSNVRRPLGWTAVTRSICSSSLIS